MPYPGQLLGHNLLHSPELLRLKGGIETAHLEAVELCIIQDAVLRAQSLSEPSKALCSSSGCSRLWMTSDSAASVHTVLHCFVEAV